MNLFQLTATIIALAAVSGFVNQLFFRLPTTIGIMLIAIIWSLGVVILGLHGPASLSVYLQQIVNAIDINQVFMHGMLSFLLFAGALHINLEDLSQQRIVVLTLATVGVAGSTIFTGLGTYAICSVLGLDLPLLYCFLFGALISPTDPVSVIGILKTAKAPKSLETKISGEALFNDGIGVVIYLVLLGIVEGRAAPNIDDISLLFLVETVGGGVYGVALGYLGYGMLKQIDSYSVEVLITLAVVMAGFAAADAIGVSAPIAMVVAGLIIGNKGRVLGMSETTRMHLDTFWKLIDEILNAILFLLIGLEIAVLTFNTRYVAAGITVVVLVILSRFVWVGLCVGLLRQVRTFSPHAVKIITWAGVRGGISVALALAIPANNGRELIIAMTYLVVVFSIVTQGLTVGPLIRRLHHAELTGLLRG